MQKSLTNKYVVLSLPKMPDKNVKVAVFADGDDIKKSKDAGAEIIGMKN